MRLWTDLFRPTRYGNEAKKAYSSLGAAENELPVVLLQLDNGLFRVQRQLEFSQRIRHLMSSRHRDIHERSLVIFQSKLDILKSMFQDAPSPTNHDSMESFKYFWNKKSILEAAQDLQTWQALTDQSWFLLMTIVDPGVDTALADNELQISSFIPSTSTIRSSWILKTSSGGARLMLPYGEIEQMEISNIAFSDIKSAKRSRPLGASTTYILSEICDLRSPPGSHFSRYTIAKEDSEKLASRLQHQEPENFGLLTCKGFTLSGTKADPKITLILWIPPDFLPSPRSLRDVLLTMTLDSLTQRLDIAKGLAKSVGYVHTLGFVHKNIRPESVLCFTRPGAKTIFTFLAGFELFRRDMGWTQRLGDVSPDKNLYRHPSRQGIHPELNYTMQHDVYSLGVCLLEIGLWRSFVNYTTSSNGATPWVSSNLNYSTETSNQELTEGFAANTTKERLLSLTRDDLPQFMGDKYSEVTMNCLTFMEEPSMEFSDGSEASDGQENLMGVTYMEKVRASHLLRLPDFIAKQYYVTNSA